MKKQYPGKYPQKPNEPVKPELKHYVGQGAITGDNIYYDIEPIGDNDMFEEICQDTFGEVPKTPPQRYWEHLSLQDIIDLAPKNIKLSDIILNINYPRMLDFLEVSFSIFIRDREKEMQLYKTDLNRYTQNLIEYKDKYDEYLEEKFLYDDWCKQQEINDLEEKLNNLKK